MKKFFAWMAMAGLSISLVGCAEKAPAPPAAPPTAETPADGAKSAEGTATPAPGGEAAPAEGDKK